MAKVEDVTAEGDRKGIIVRTSDGKTWRIKAELIGEAYVQDILDDGEVIEER